MNSRFLQLSLVLVKSIISSVFTALVLICFLLFISYIIPFKIKLDTNQEPSLPPQQNVSIISTLSYSDALQTYEHIATAAIESSERALDVTKWLIGAFLALSTIAFGTAVNLYKNAKEAGEKAQRAETAAQDAKIAVLTIENRINTLATQYAQLVENYVEISKQYLKYRGTSSALDKAIESWENGEITRESMIETQQWHSWKKWIQEENITGYTELYEVAQYGQGLIPTVKAAIEVELEDVKQKISNKTNPSAAEIDYKNRLCVLLGINPEKL